MLYVAWQTWQDRDPVFFDEGTGESPFPLCSAVVGGKAVGVVGVLGLELTPWKLLKAKKKCWNVLFRHIFFFSNLMC